MEKIEQVAAAAVGFGIGWKGASIFTENDNLPTYDTKTQEIYENISFAYHTHIDSQKLPDTWKTDKEKQKIRPKKEATKLSNAIPYYKKMTMTLMKNQSEVVCKLYRHILLSIIELFESIKIKHNEPK